MLTTQQILGFVKDYADKAHGDQKRKYSDDKYIVHPLRVMKTCQEYTNDVTVLAAAVLHDVLEDTEITEDQMLQFLISLMPEEQAKSTLQKVVELTDVYTKQDYPDMNRRTRKIKEHERLVNISPDAQTIKYADIIDNTCEIVKEDPEFAERFLFECKLSLEGLNKGDQKLYEKATRIVNESMAAQE